MTAPVLTNKKFYIIKPEGGVNQIKNPTFASPDFEEDWTAIGGTIAETSDEQRWGDYSMKVNPATGVSSGAYHGGLTVANTLAYTFSCYVKGVAGQAMRILISDGADAVKATKQFTATGYWQRVEVTHTAAENAVTYRAKVLRDAVASTAAYYVDGAQFEQASKASTFFDGYTAGCRWTGAIRNSPSARSDNTGLGGELVDLSDYCEIVSVSGLGHGDWNQILTKMTSGGDMYQTHIRKSRNFSIVVDFIGDTLGKIEANRKAVIDMLRPDLLSNLSVREQFGINMPGSYRGHEQRIIRYQGVDVNGVEATNPLDIVCVPLSATLTDTPDLPTYQRAILNFSIPSGLLQGAYQEGRVLDLYADFPADYLVMRNENGDWCKYNSGTDSYDSLVSSDTPVYCMTQDETGRAYFGHHAPTSSGLTSIIDSYDGLSYRSVLFENVGGVPAFVNSLALDGSGNLYAGGNYYVTGHGAANIGKFSDLEGTPTFTPLGSETNGDVYAIAIGPNGDVYVGGTFTLAGGVAGTSHIAKWNGTSWSTLSTGLNNTVRALAFAPNGDLYIGGDFTDTAYPYLCKWNGTAFSAVGTNTDINGAVYTLAFGATGWLYVGGAFTNAGDVPNADYIARWGGSHWEPLGTGTSARVQKISQFGGRLYVCGEFDQAGGITITDRVAMWQNGAWFPINIELPDNYPDIYIYDILATSKGQLYIAGDFKTGLAIPVLNAKTSMPAISLSLTTASANTYPVISVTGPGTLKSITNYRTGKSVGFDGLTLQAGEWISLNFDPLNLSFRSGWASRGNLMRYVIPGSDYGDFYVSPGENYISVFITDIDEDITNASIVCNPKFWGLDGALL